MEVRNHRKYIVDSSDSNIYSCRQAESYMKRLDLSSVHSKLKELRLLELKNWVNIDDGSSLEVRKKALEVLTKNLNTKSSEISLSNLGLKSIPPLSRFKWLKHLDLSHNSIDLIKRSDFYGLTKLHCLNLSFNSIVNIEVSAFSSLESLVSLNLSSNLLSNFSDSLLIRNPVLKKIDLSYNQFKEIDLKCWSFLRHLDTVELHHNQLSSFDLKGKDYRLSLYDNPLNSEFLELMAENDDIIFLMDPNFLPCNSRRLFESFELVFSLNYDCPFNKKFWMKLCKTCSKAEQENIDIFLNFLDSFYDISRLISTSELSQFFSNLVKRFITLLDGSSSAKEIILSFSDFCSSHMFAKFSDKCLFFVRLQLSFNIYSEPDPDESLKALIASDKVYLDVVSSFIEDLQHGRLYYDLEREVFVKDLPEDFFKDNILNLSYPSREILYLLKMLGESQLVTLVVPFSTSLLGASVEAVSEPAIAYIVEEAKNKLSTRSDSVSLN